MPVDVPNHEFDAASRQPSDALLVDLHADGRQVLFGEHAVDEARRPGWSCRRRSRRAGRSSSGSSTALTGRRGGPVSGRGMTRAGCCSCSASVVAWQESSAAETPRRQLNVRQASRASASCTRSARAWLSAALRPVRTIAVGVSREFRRRRGDRLDGSAASSCRRCAIKDVDGWLLQRDRSSIAPLAKPIRAALDHADETRFGSSRRRT